MQATVRDLMSTDVIAVPRHTGLDEAERLLLGSGVDELFVIDHQELLCGVVPDYELLKRRLAFTPDAASFPCSMTGTVESIMSRRFLVIDPDSPLPVAAIYLREHLHRRLAVVDGRRLIGQITRRSLLAHLASSQDANRSHTTGTPVTPSRRIDDPRLETLSPRGALRSKAATSSAPTAS